MSEYPSMYDAAIEYAKKGFAVFPLKYRDKVPLTRNGCKDATTDAAQIKAWWQKYPNANIGLATGSVSQNVFVIDLDIDEDRGIDGYHSLEDWQREHGDFPETWTAITGRGGYHLYYRGNGKIKNRAGIIDGVDIRGNGGYVVAPPSIHKNGNRYEWEYSPDEFEIAKADNNVEYFLNHDDHRQSASFTMPNIVSAGQRNQMLFRFACMMQAKGASDQSVFAATMAENESSCSPPLTEQEVRIIVSSATKYDKGKPIHIDSEGVATRENKDDVIGNPEWVLSFLDCNHDKDGNIKSVKQFVHNFEIVMDKDDRFAGKIRFNEFAQQLYLCGNVPWEKEDNCRAWSSHDDSALFSLVQADYGLKSRQDFADALKNVSMRNKFHPVRELLDSLTWDGKEHIRSLLPEYLGAEDSDYTYQVMRLWMLGAVSRVYKPGNKFDYTIILQGSQGIGKSTFLKQLAMDDSWFNDSLDSLDSDKAVQSLTGSWIIELAELKSLARTAGGVESVKRFLTATQDKYRIPYERRADTFYRQCVFAGTTNKDDFLQDETGNRRSSIVEAQKTVSSSTGKMKTDAETNLAGVKKAAEDASGGVNTTTVTNWGNSASEVKKNLDKMKQTANLKLGEMQKTVESHFSGQYNTMTKKWEKACERIGQLITQMVRSTKDSLNGLARNMNTIGNEMSNNLINGISGAVTGIARILNEVVNKVNSTISNVNSSLSGIENAFTFSYDVTTPDGKRRWGKYSMNLPRVNTVPYLATASADGRTDET